MAEIIPWSTIEKEYADLFPSNAGTVAKPLRMALGALIIKEKCGFTDRETVEQITENPYLQYFIGLEKYQIEPPVITATMPAPVLPGSLVSPSAMAYIMTQKYVESMALYRQEKQFARLGIELSRQTMANWVIQGAERWLDPLYKRMHEHLLKQDILHADETTLQVLREPVG